MAPRIYRPKLPGDKTSRHNPLWMPGRITLPTRNARQYPTEDENLLALVEAALAREPEREE